MFSTLINIINKKRDISLLPVIAAVFVLTACGGGGGGGDNNSAPTAASGSLNIPSNVAVSDKLLATDPENNELTYTILSSGTSGTATITNSSTGEFTYTPDPSVITGSDTITFKVNDGTSDSNIATILISIVDATSAVDDGYTVDEGATINTNAANSVLVNDVSNSSDTLTALIVAGPSFASSFALNPDGTFDYTHDGSEDLTDSFTYKVNNGRNDSNTATVTINVNAINDSPVAANQSLTVNEGATINVNATNGLKSGATDPDTPLANITANTTPVSPPSRGTVTISADGSYSYTHDGSQTTSDSFTFRLSDGFSNSSLKTVTITVIPINNSPIAANQSLTIDEGATKNINAANGLKVGASDPDTALANITAVTTPVTPPSHGTVNISADGSYSYTNDGNEFISDSFTFRLNDGFSNSSFKTVTITINPINDSPIAANQNLTLDEGATKNVNAANGLKLGATDPDTLLVNVNAVTTPVSPPANGTVNINADGSYTYTHDSSETTSDSFTFRLNDGVSNSSLKIVNITVIPVNDSPVAKTGICGTAHRGVGAGLNKSEFVTGTDAEDPANALSYALQTNGSKGVVTNLDLSTGAFIYTPNNGVNDWGTDTFSFTVTDTNGATDTATVTILIDPRIMPLGDSITAGVLTSLTDPLHGDRIGYRKPLYDLLTSDQLNYYGIEFVGSQTDGANNVGFDVDHQGLPSWSAADIADGNGLLPELPNTVNPNEGVYEWLLSNPAEIILLHIGTNAFDSTVIGGVNDVKRILDEIDRFEEFRYGIGKKNIITVYLAKIIGTIDGNLDVNTFNNNVVNMVNARPNDNIIIVDQFNAITNYFTGTGGEMASNLHPNAVGYSLMADAWYNELLKIPTKLVKCP